MLYIQQSSDADHIQNKRGRAPHVVRAPQVPQSPPLVYGEYSDLSYLALNGTELFLSVESS